jgi:hypothetical protein
MARTFGVLEPYIFVGTRPPVACHTVVHFSSRASVPPKRHGGTHTHVPVVQIYLST